MITDIKLNQVIYHHAINDCSLTTLFYDGSKTEVGGEKASKDYGINFSLIRFQRSWRICWDRRQILKIINDYFKNGFRQGNRFRYPHDYFTTVKI